METSNEDNKDPRFCINLQISNAWVTNIALETENGALPAQVVEVDYDNLPMRCRICLSWKHKAKDCEVGKKKKKNTYERPNIQQIPQSMHQKGRDKGKGIEIDHEGFQKVVYRDRGARRNIFDHPEERGNLGNMEATTSGHGGGSTTKIQVLVRTWKEIMAPTGYPCHRALHLRAEMEKAREKDLWRQEELWISLRRVHSSYKEPS